MALPLLFLVHESRSLTSVTLAAVLTVMRVLTSWEKPARLQAHEMHNCGDPEGSAIILLQILGQSYLGALYKND